MPLFSPIRKPTHASVAWWRHVVLGTCAVLGLSGLPATAWADVYSDVQQLYDRGEQSQALAQANAYINAHPGDPQMRFVKANLLSNQGKTDQAEAMLLGITQEYPELAEPWNNLAVLYANGGLLTDAEEALESALRIDPNYATALENLGDVRVRLAQQAYQQSRASGNKAGRLEHKINALQQLMDAQAESTGN